MDFSAVLANIDFDSTSAAILAVAALWMVVEVIYRGVWFVLDMVGGPDPDDPNDPRNYDHDVFK